MNLDPNLRTCFEPMNPQVSEINKYLSEFLERNHVKLEGYVSKTTDSITNQGKFREKNFSLKKTPSQIEQEINNLRINHKDIEDSQ